MLKVSVLFSLVLICGTSPTFSGRNYRRSASHGQMMNVTELIKSNGYPVRQYTVQTSDGYLLDLIRIPWGIRNSKYQQGQSQTAGYEQKIIAGYGDYRSQQEAVNNYENQQGSVNMYGNQQTQMGNQENDQEAHPQSGSLKDEDYNGSDEQAGHRPVVLLMHGALSSADDFVISGPTQGLAYILADQGYDVYLGNARGSTYGRRHTVLDPDRDAAFWKFCWDQMGRLDLPAIIDKILETSSQKHLYYIGHMQGSTVFYVMASERPEYTEKIHYMVALGPVAFMGQTSNVMLKLVADNLHSEGWLVKNLGTNEFKPSSELITKGGETDCQQLGNNEQICKNEFFLLNGYNSKNLNSETITSLLQRVPAGASAREIRHFAQLVKSGRFQKYADNSQPQGQHHYGTVEDYDLSKVTLPVTLIYAPNDPISALADVEILKKKLPNVVQSIRVDAVTNNLDLLFANNIKANVHDNMVRMMQNINHNNGYTNVY